MTKTAPKTKAKAKPKAAAKPTPKTPKPKPAARGGLTIRAASADQSVTVPLDQLLPPEYNVRRKMDTRIIAELQSSIPHMGILSALTVVKKGGKFLVINGAHRLAALNKLAADGAIAKTYQVPCVVKPATIDALEAGLAENTIRAAMDPLDECEAFKKLLDADTRLTVADVAQRFGVTGTVVNKRLTLAGMPAKIAKAYREGRINLEQLQAFAATDDMKKRLAVFEDMDGRGVWKYQDGDDIRSQLTEDVVSATDQRVRFVGLEAYEAAGGATYRDLFSDDADGISILDPELLNRLVTEKLTAESERLKAEGWGWVRVKAGYIDYRDTGGYDQIKPKKADLSAADAKTLKDVQKKINALEEIRDAEDGDGELTDKQYEQLEILEAQKDALEEKMLAWSDKDKARSGVMVGFRGDGAFDYKHALVNPKEEKKAAKAAAIEAGDDETVAAIEKREVEEGGVPKRILEDLTIHRSSALAARLSDEPLLALAALVYTWALRDFYTGTFGESCISASRMEAFGRLSDEAGPHTGHNKLLEKREHWLDKTPEKEKDLWEWCRAQSQDTLLRLLAYFVANSLDDINVTGRSHDFAIRLAQIVQLDMAKFYTPTADNLFSHLPKPTLAGIIREVEDRTLTAEEQKMKKGDLARVVEGAVTGKGWLPPQLRVQAMKVKDVDADDAEDDDADEYGQDDEDADTDPVTDHVQKFIAARCRLTEGAEISVVDINDAYEAWSAEEKVHPFDRQAVNKAISSVTGVAMIRKSGGYHFTGVQLASATEGD